MSDSSVFQRSFGRSYPVAVSGAGVYIHTTSGQKVLDGSSGAAVSSLGHGHPAPIQAIVEQAQSMAFAHTSFFTNYPTEKLASLLLQQSNGAFAKALFLSSGSEAFESSVKLARQYHICNNQPRRINFISRKYSYHGNTLGALSAGYNPPRRQNFEPILSPVFHHVSPCFYSRDARDGETEDAYVSCLIQEFEEAFSRLDPTTVAAVVLEPVSGATLGSAPAAKGYLPRLRSICDKHGALLIYDEVMCGMGRVGTFHAWQALGNVAPDIQAIGKGLGAGYQPISGVLLARNVYKTLQDAAGDHPFISGHTYQGHAIASAAALAVQQTIIDDELIPNVRRMGELLSKQLQELTPRLKEVRGLGLFRTVDFLTSPDHRIASKVAATCLEQGAAVYLCSAAVDAVMFAPPFIINETEVHELVQIFVTSVKQVLEEAELGASRANL
ncbi:PLP-dependent transferase [Lophiostoma macrostomum CBS 122681]|uniref:PLP-dependent transferase n=1 Tax=Lophiostoma macrostomum CBS 122681 TaxID=1314788 RepID=A0A6A6SIR1_9PLEO|nr:PLP-dependent transferase [Lophiostoma macrostomum CBS 122681]